MKSRQPYQVKRVINNLTFSEKYTLVNKIFSSEDNSGGNIFGRDIVEEYENEYYTFIREILHEVIRMSKHGNPDEVEISYIAFYNESNLVAQLKDYER